MLPVTLEMSRIHDREYYGTALPQTPEVSEETQTTYGAIPLQFSSTRKKVKPFLPVWWSLEKSLQIF